MTIEKIKTIAKEKYGRELTDEQAVAYKDKYGRLSDDELDNVSGGSCLGEDSHLDDASGTCPQCNGQNLRWSDTSGLMKQCRDCGYIFNR